MTAVACDEGAPSSERLRTRVAEWYGQCFVPASNLWRPTMTLFFARELFPSRRVPSGVGFLLLSSTLGLSACMTDNGTAVNGEEATTSPAAQVTLTDNEIAGVTAAIHEGEISHARIAQERAQTEPVRSFAARMIEEHSSAMRDLEGLGATASIIPEPSALREQLTSQALAMEQDLVARDPSEFDRAYMDAQVRLHQQALEVADQQLMPSARSQQLRAYLQRVRPIIADHLEMARQMTESPPLAAR